MEYINRMTLRGFIYDDPVEKTLSNQSTVLAFTVITKHYVGDDTTLYSEYTRISVPSPIKDNLSAQKNCEVWVEGRKRSYKNKNGDWFTFLEAESIQLGRIWQVDSQQEPASSKPQSEASPQDANPSTSSPLAIKTYSPDEPQVF